ncbi:dCTP deaminase [candidate division GN15 bacterium]|uniref:dCTP deaminase n=1 Tax=candidate division GN15 bacterium TaxID=2072418 RepID=A0A855X2E0_9BACT|nr:MAG: dCTP deaminase [candidate division GN15 bacterium]
MPVKSDRWIIAMAESHGMIEPFSARQIRSGISFGVSSYGYDFSLADEFRIFDPTKVTELDPKNVPTDGFKEIRTDSILLPANSFLLARSREYFRIPRDIVTVCFGKSTYARCGLIVNVTPFEPEWEGFATVSLANSGPRPVRVYANEGIAQIIFLQADEQCETSYKDKNGKYQAQKTITMAKSDIPTDTQ